MCAVGNALHWWAVWCGCGGSSDASLTCVSSSSSMISLLLMPSRSPAAKCVWGGGEVDEAGGEESDKVRDVCVLGRGGG